MMSNSSVGRVAVVTGGNKGIGFYIALQLGLSGLFQHILLACRDESRAQVAVASLQAQLPAQVQVSSELLSLGDEQSHQRLADRLVERFDNKIDVLVNNAAMAFKNADPTPFREQCKPTLDVNFRATVDLTQRLMPLLSRGSDPRLVNVASISGQLGQLAPERQAQFSAPDITMPRLQTLVDEFQADVLEGNHQQRGWGNSNYGMSKLALIAATKIWARDFSHISINCCCPGYCKTDMSSHKGSRDPADGAKNAVLPATMSNPPTGEFFQDYKPSVW